MSMCIAFRKCKVFMSLGFFLRFLGFFFSARVLFLIRVCVLNIMLKYWMSPWLLEISQHIIISYQECLGKINHSRSLGVSDTTAIPLSEAGKHICLVLHFKVGSQSCSAVRDQPGWLTVTELSSCVPIFCSVWFCTLLCTSSVATDLIWCILRGRTPDDVF